MKQKKQLLGVVLSLMPFSVYAEPFAYVANIVSDTVSVIDAATNTVVGAPIPVGDAPVYTAVTPDGKKVYVTNNNDDTVTPIDATTNTPGAPISVGNGPFDLAISPDGTLVYVTNLLSNDISVIDTVTDTVVNTIPSVSFPFIITISPNGKTLYVMSQATGDIFPIDAQTGVIGAVVANGGPIVITPNGKTAYVAVYFSNIVRVLNLITNQFGPDIPTGDNPLEMAITPDGKLLYVVVQGDNEVIIIDTKTNTIVGSPIPIGPAALGIAITPDGTMAYVTSNSTDRVTPIDLRTNTAGASILVGVGPYGVATQPSPPLSPGPIEVTGTIVRNTFLNRSDRLLVITWEENPEEESVVAYRIFNGDELVGTVAATEPLLFYIKLCCNQETNNFSVASIFAGDVESDRVLVVV